MEGDEGDGRAEGADELFEGGEGVRCSGVEIRLVDFVREEHEIVSFAEAHYVLHRRLVEHRARWIARVDDHERLGLDALRDRLLYRRLDLRRGCGPVRFLVEVIGNPHPGVRSQGCAVQRVLGYGDEDAGLGV